MRLEKIKKAAGFNKNAEIPPSVMKNLGFERVVIGSVTYDKWDGKPRSRTMRVPKTKSLVNWMGLPGVGAEVVAERLENYEYANIPITINFMSTPEKEGDELLRDLEQTVHALRDIYNVDRFTLNISCPNTDSKSGKIDARSEYQEQVEGMLDVVSKLVLSHQSLYLKVSPDLNRSLVEETISVAKKYNVAGIVATNTTTNHDDLFIPNSPGKGGASGNAVYVASREVQRMFAEIITEQDLDMNIIACGGINSVNKVRTCFKYRASEIQIYTPIIFSGPKFIRELRGTFKA